MRHDLIQSSAVCLPCKKEEICQQLATAMIATGHAMMQAGAWTAPELEAWNARLDAFIADAKAMLEAGPLAENRGRGRGSSAVGGGNADLPDSPALA